MEEQGMNMSIARQVYDQLKMKIIKLELMPGQLLLVQQLSKDLQFSRTPVREALIRLRDDGLVEEADGRKFRVTNIHQKQIEDIYEVRILLEGMAVQELAQHITPEQIQNLRDMIAQMDRHLSVHDNEKYFEVDFHFHHYLLELYNNQMFLLCLDRVKDQQQRIRYLTLSIYRRMDDSIAEHKRIVDCLQERDGIGARNMLCAHLKNAEEELNQLLASNYLGFLVSK